MKLEAKFDSQAIISAPVDKPKEELAIGSKWLGDLAATAEATAWHPSGDLMEIILEDPAASG